MPLLGTEVGLGPGPGDSVLDGDPAPSAERGTATPTFRSMSLVVKRSPISATVPSSYWLGFRPTLPIVKRRHLRMKYRYHCAYCAACTFRLSDCWGPAPRPPNAPLSIPMIIACLPSLWNTSMGRVSTTLRQVADIAMQSVVTLSHCVNTEQQILDDPFHVITKRNLSDQKI